MHHYTTVLSLIIQKSMFLLEYSPSDEGYSQCGICPIKEGFLLPRNYETFKQLLERGNNYYAKAGSSKLATFSCKHKVTKRPICATPCNGIPEMCEDDKDEECQGADMEIILSSSMLFSIFFLALTFLVDYFAVAKTTTT